MNPYDVLNYPSKPFRFTRFDRMELFARLHGLDAAPATTARVLELGCGTGGNLLPMAQAFPKSRCLGIDLSAGQIAWGNQVREEAGLDNVELRALDLADVNASFGEFDYVIAHGVYSWVDASVKARLLDVMSERLAPGGVAYLSYNVKPGWYEKAAARDMMLYHIVGDEDEREKVRHARALLEFLAAGARTSDPSWRTVLEQQRDLAKKMSDGVVRFDHLCEVNDALYFHELVAELPARRFEYLSDASISATIPDRIPDEAVRVLNQLGRKDIIAREQYMDFLKNRRFRCSLLVRAGAPISREVSLDRLAGVHIVSQAKPIVDGADLDGPTTVTFEAPSGRAHLASPATKRALVDLAARYPAARPLDELLEQAGPEKEQLAAELFQLFTHEMVDLWPHPDAFVVSPSAHPVASPLARTLALRSSMVSNLRHDTVDLDAAERELLLLLDGTREAAALPAAPLASLGKKALLIA